MLTKRQIQSFIKQHRLPDKFGTLINNHYAAVVEIAAKLKGATGPALLGINGAQGTGKSTLASFIKLALESEGSVRVANLSLDNFYLTKAQRATLSHKVHPLFVTRGVPGTHDLQLLNDCLTRLRTLQSGETLGLPSFDKSLDDRSEEAVWARIEGPVDLIILEGWCVGSVAQQSVTQAINSLEREQDSKAVWRTYVNQQLKNRYQKLFVELDYLIFLQAPSFEAIFRWRKLQEEKLAMNNPAAELMDTEQMRVFLLHYERITRANLATLPHQADLTLVFDEHHQCVSRHNKV